MKWTRDLPTVAGSYWFRRKENALDREPRVVEVRDYAGRLAMGNSTIDKDWPKAEWAGPIAEPEE